MIGGKRSDNWHIKFTPPRWSVARAKLGKTRIVRSTGTSDLASGKHIAEQIINAHWKLEKSLVAKVHATPAAVTSHPARHLKTAIVRARVSQAMKDAVKKLAAERGLGGEAESIIIREALAEFFDDRGTSVRELRN